MEGGRDSESFPVENAVEGGVGHRALEAERESWAPESEAARASISVEYKVSRGGVPELGGHNVNAREPEGVVGEPEELAGKGNADPNKLEGKGFATHLVIKNGEARAQEGKNV